MAPLPTALFAVSAVLPLAADLPDPASASGIGWLLVSAGGLFLALNQGADFIARFRKTAPTGTEIIGQPLEVRPSPEYVRREEFSELSGRVAHMEAKFDAAVATLSEAGEDRARRLHSRMDTILSAVARVEGELKRIPTPKE